jgi:hypothetical protein
MNVAGCRVLGRIGIMDDEIHRELEKEFKKSTRIGPGRVPLRIVVLVLVATLAGFVALALATM